jgi:predicted RND superfamily exporter protein
MFLWLLCKLIIVLFIVILVITKGIQGLLKIKVEVRIANNFEQDLNKFE